MLKLGLRQEELQSRMGEVNLRLGEGPAPSDTVSRSEMVELAKVLKKALEPLGDGQFIWAIAMEVPRFFSSILDWDFHGFSPK